MRQDPPSVWLTASRYGTLQDAQTGTALIHSKLAAEMQAWFGKYESIIGIASRVLELR